MSGSSILVVDGDEAIILGCIHTHHGKYMNSGTYLNCDVLERLI